MSTTTNSDGSSSVSCKTKKPVKKLNSLEQLQKDHKELEERCCGLEQQLEEKVKERDNWKDAYNELHKESDEYYEKWIETNGKYLALKDIVDRLIK